MTTQASRWDVAGSGGGQLAVWITGEGPAVVLVHGSMSDHTTFDPLVAALDPSFTTFAMDRRGFGSSPDTDDYSAEREFGDVAAVVDAVSQRTGEAAVLFGHSWGASCAIGGAALSRNIGRLILYEPSLGLKYPPGYIDGVQKHVAAGDWEAAIVSVLTDLAGMSAEQVDAMKSSPSWPSRLATAPTIAREALIEDGWVHEPAQFESITAPTLFLAGSESPSDLAEVTRKCAAVIRGARIHELRGRDHFAYKTHPAEIAAIIGGFVGAPSRAT
jgi:pimeloyl-ACP methyl ester carboxylesterase